MLSTKQFTYIKKDRLLIADASDLDLDNHIIQVFPDSCDEGFDLYSNHTGRVVRFVCRHDEWNNEGELLWHDYVPISDFEQRDIELTVRVYND